MSRLIRQNSSINNILFWFVLIHLTWHQTWDKKKNCLMPGHSKLRLIDLFLSLLYSDKVLLIAIVLLFYIGLRKLIYLLLLDI